MKEILNEEREKAIIHKVIDEMYMDKIKDNFNICKNKNWEDYLAILKNDVISKKLNWRDLNEKKHKIKRKTIGARKRENRISNKKG